MLRHWKLTVIGGFVFLFAAILVAAIMGAGATERKYRAQDFFTDPKAAELAEAARDGDVKRVDALVEQGVDINAKGKQDLSVLMYAMSGPTLNGFQRLLERGANPNQQKDGGESAMSFAACRKEPAALQLLLAHGGNPNIRTSENSLQPTPIYNAIRAGKRQGNVENARLLIKAGADLNVRDDLGYTPLTSAAIDESYGVMYLLLEAGADFRAEVPPGFTVTYILEENESRPLRNDCMKAKQKCIDFLKKKGVDFEEEKKKNAEFRKRRKEKHKQSNEKHPQQPQGKPNGLRVILPESW